MVGSGRKSVEPIALLVAHGDASGLQKFMNVAPWSYDDVQAEAHAIFGDITATRAGASARSDNTATG